MQWGQLEGCKDRNQPLLLFNLALKHDQMVLVDCSDKIVWVVYCFKKKMTQSIILNSLKCELNNWYKLITTFVFSTFYSKVPFLLYIFLTFLYFIEISFFVQQLQMGTYYKGEKIKKRLGVIDHSNAQLLFKKKIQRCKFDFVRRLIKSVTALYNLSVSAKDKRLLIYIKTYTFLAGFNRKCNHITSLVKRTIFKNKTLIY